MHTQSFEIFNTSHSLSPQQTKILNLNKQLKNTQRREVETYSLVSQSVAPLAIALIPITRK